MKSLSLLAAALICLTSSAFAEAPQKVWPMPSPFPSVPQGVNPATFPAPRLDWIERVETFNQRGKAEADQIQLIFDGDSITDWWQTGGRQTYDERFGRFHPIDFAIAGDRTQNVLWRLSQGQAEGIRPKLIVLMIGTNNIGSNSAEEIAAGVKAIIAAYQKRCPGAPILLQAVLPRVQDPNSPYRAEVKKINALISKFADGKKVLYLDFGDKFLAPDGTLLQELMPDFLHPSPKGYELWADAIQPIIDQYLAK